MFLGNDENKIARKAFDLVLQLDEIFKDKEKLESFTEMQRQGLDNLLISGWEYFKELCDVPWVSHHCYIIYDLEWFWLICR